MPGGGVLLLYHHHYQSPPYWISGRGCLYFGRAGVTFENMDQGHYNCRDYHITPHCAPTTIASETGRHPLERHESFQELEERCRSPASQRPKFPLLKLPLELRQQIFGYLLPHTQEFRDSGLLSEHARNFSAVKKRGARGMVIPSGVSSNSAPSVSNVVWQRGNINLLRVCKQLHDECAELLYGTNTFLLFITYAGISFRFRWLLPSGLAPSRSYNFLDTVHYKHLIRRVVVHVDNIDSYTAMIKFNVDGNGLIRGLHQKVQALVDALQASDKSIEDGQREPLSKVHIKVSNGNAVLDALKSNIVREREGGVKMSEDIEQMLEPFGQLRGVQQAFIGGAVSDAYARNLEETMKSERDGDEMSASKSAGAARRMSDQTFRAFASSDDKMRSNVAALIRGF